MVGVSSFTTILKGKFAYNFPTIGPNEVYFSSFSSFNELTALHNVV